MPLSIQRLFVHVFKPYNSKLKTALIIGVPEHVIVKMEPLIFLTLKTIGEGLHKEC